MRAAVATHTLLPLAAVTAGLASSSSLAAEWMFTPAGDITAQSQRNPGLSPNEDQKHEMSNGMGATLSVGVQRRTEQSTFLLQPSVHAFRYDDNNSLDRDEEFLSLAYDWLGEKVSWHAGGAASHDTTLTSELGTTGLTQGNLRHESYDITVGPTWVLTERWQMRSTLETLDSRYPVQRSGLDNNRYNTALLSTSYVASEKLSVSLYGTSSRLDSEGAGPDTRSRSANVSAQYAWSPLSSIGASIGQSWVQSGAGSNSGPLYSLNASHAFEKGSVALSVSRRQSPSGRALLTEADEVSLDAAIQITERLSASASASYSKRRSVLRIFDADLQRVRYSRTDLGLSWRMAAHWRVNFNVGAATQQVGSDFFIDDSTGRGYDAHLGLSWNGDPYVR